MKYLITLLYFISFISNTEILFAQESQTISNDYLTRNPIYDYDAQQLSNTDSIPDFLSKQEKLKITGTVFLSDGITPAKDVILYIQQPNENGDYEVKIKDGKRYVHHRAWVKTDTNGHYTLYTFIPGNYSRTKYKYIQPIIKEAGKQEYALEAFVFDNDQSLSKYCRKRLAKRGVDNILKIETKDQMFVATKNIVLKDSAL